MNAFEDSAVDPASALIELLFFPIRHAPLCRVRPRLGFVRTGVRGHAETRRAETIIKPTESAVVQRTRAANPRGELLRVPRR